MMEDITEAKRAQEQAIARQKLESLGVLASGIAHDFNNLLGGILASAELAMTECTDGSDIHDDLQRIKIASLRGAEIVRELMLFGGEESPAFEPVDISVLVNEMLQLLKVSIPKHTTLKFELAPDLPLVYGSAAQMRQVVMNLVINASEAIGEQPGTIQVATSKVEIVPTSLRSAEATRQKSDCVRLEISDTGCGMTPEVRTKIFDPFFTTKQAGRGLGLAAVQGILMAMAWRSTSRALPARGPALRFFCRASMISRK